jgi:hypothetical protein
MGAINNVGKVFGTAAEFLDYLDDLQFTTWRPSFITMHHTGAPNLKTWNDWQTRAKPVSDEQWLRNLAVYYGSPPPLGPADGPWRSGPHFMFTPAHFCVLSPPTARGVHAKSFNAVSLGVECVGDFDREPWGGALAARYIEGIACLHLALGLQPDPFQRGVRGLHFHRDDLKTSKTCPGNHVDKDSVVAAVKDKMAAMSGGDHPEEKISAPIAARVWTGTVNENGLNVRADASARAPAVRTLNKGAVVSVIREAMNGDTKWLAIGDGEWVAARFVSL